MKSVAKLAPLTSALSLFVTAGAWAQAAPPISPAQADSLTESQVAAKLPKEWAVLKAGSWNVDLRPWFSNQEQVIKELRKGEFEVLALQGVWSEEAKDTILADKHVKAKYKHSYWVPPEQDLAFCSLSIPRSDLEDMLTCVLLSGVDPRTAIQPLTPIDPFCDLLQVGIALRDEQLCLECIGSTLEGFDDGRSPFDVIDICSFQGGVKNSSEGLPGLLLLSEKPIVDAQTVRYDSYRTSRAVVYATINGVRIAVTHLPDNHFANIDPGFAYLTPGPLQPQIAQDIINRAPRLVLGTFNSNAQYQPEAADLFTAAGYKPLTSKPTFCPATHSSFQPCVAAEDSPYNPPGAVDNIYQAPGVFCTERTKLGSAPVSLHVGVGSVCVIKK